MPISDLSQLKPMQRIKPSALMERSEHAVRFTGTSDDGEDSFEKDDSSKEPKKQPKKLSRWKKIAIVATAPLGLLGIGTGAVVAPEATLVVASTATAVGAGANTVSSSRKKRKQSEIQTIQANTAKLVQKTLDSTDGVSTNIHHQAKKLEVTAENVLDQETLEALLQRRPGNPINPALLIETLKTLEACWSLTTNLRGFGDGFKTSLDLKYTLEEAYTRLGLVHPSQDVQAHVRDYLANNNSAYLDTPLAQTSDSLSAVTITTTALSKKLIKLAGQTDSAPRITGHNVFTADTAKVIIDLRADDDAPASFEDSTLKVLANIAQYASREEEHQLLALFAENVDHPLPAVQAYAERIAFNPSLLRKGLDDPSSNSSQGLNITMPDGMRADSPDGQLYIKNRTLYAEWETLLNITGISNSDSINFRRIERDNPATLREFTKVIIEARKIAGSISDLMQDAFKNEPVVQNVIGDEALLPNENTILRSLMFETIDDLNQGSNVTEMDLARQLRNRLSKAYNTGDLLGLSLPGDIDESIRPKAFEGNIDDLTPEQQLDVIASEVDRLDFEIATINRYSVNLIFGLKSSELSLALKEKDVQDIDERIDEIADTYPEGIDLPHTITEELVTLNRDNERNKQRYERALEHHQNLEKNFAQVSAMLSEKLSQLQVSKDGLNDMLLGGYFVNNVQEAEKLKRKISEELDKQKLNNIFDELQYQQLLAKVSSEGSRNFKEVLEYLSKEVSGEEVNSEHVSDQEGLAEDNTDIEAENEHSIEPGIEE